MVENDFISTLKDDVGITATCVLRGWLSQELEGRGWAPQGAKTSSSNPARLCRGWWSPGLGGSPAFSSTGSTRPWPLPRLSWARAASNPSKSQQISLQSQVEQQRILSIFLSRCTHTHKHTHKMEYHSLDRALSLYLLSCRLSLRHGHLSGPSEADFVHFSPRSHQMICNQALQH